MRQEMKMLQQQVAANKAQAELSAVASELASLKRIVGYFVKEQFKDSRRMHRHARTQLLEEFGSRMDEKRKHAESGNKDCNIHDSTHEAVTADKPNVDKGQVQNLGAESDEHEAEDDDGHPFSEVETSQAVLEAPADQASSWRALFRFVYGKQPEDARPTRYDIEDEESGNALLAKLGLRPDEEVEVDFEAPGSKRKRS